MYEVSEHQAYNALNIAFESQYQKLVKIFAAHNGWNMAWNFYHATFPKINPITEWQKLNEFGIRLILKSDANYPAMLKELADPPLGLYTKGAVNDEGIKIAIVGTRKATTAGETLAENFAEELGGAGVHIVSGLALGIDTAAHKGALRGNVGKTTAVLACGLDKVYPAQNARLAQEILNRGGALISEYPVLSVAFPNRFLERNRIVSGLSRGIIIIEAPVHSGSLVTANSALEQNRDVFVVPGPISHANYVGSNDLIKSGAALVTSAEDILSAYGIEPKTQNVQGVDKAGKLTTLTQEEATVFGVVKDAGNPVPIDKIIEISKLETYVVTKTLTMLAFKKLVKESGGLYDLI